MIDYKCCILPKTSCEEFNLLLDRAVVIGFWQSGNCIFYLIFIAEKSEELIKVDYSSTRLFNWLLLRLNSTIKVAALKVNLKNRFQMPLSLVIPVWNTPTHSISPLSNTYSWKKNTHSLSLTWNTMPRKTTTNYAWKWIVWSRWGGWG